jgi:hypothetical protein
VLPYWLLFAAYSIGALNTRVRQTQLASLTLALTVAAAVTTLFIGLRFEVGGDWYNYLRVFEGTSDLLGIALGEGDPAYMFLNWIAKELGLGIVFVNLVCGTICMAALVEFARREPNPWLTIAIAIPYLIIVVFMGYTRQGVAIAFTMLALATFFEHRYSRSLVFLVAAALFHKSAIIILPIFVLSVVRYRVIIWPILGAIGLLLYQYLVSAALERLDQGYIQSALESGGAGVRVAMNVLPAVLFLAFRHRFVTSEEEEKTWRYYSIASLAALAGLFLMSSSTVVDRLALYLIPLQLVVLGRLPYVFPREGKPNVQITIAVLAYSAAVQFVWLTYSAHSGDWVPYRMSF